MKIWKRIGLWRRRSKLVHDLQVEMTEHRRMIEDRYIAEGMTPADARSTAAKRFGSTALSAETSRDEWGFRWLEAVLRDVRFACRLIAKQPGITAAAVLTVALGAGANMAVVSVLQAILLNPMGVSEADRIGVATVRLEKLNLPRAETSAVEWQELSRMTDIFTHVAAMEGRYWTSDLGGEPVRVIGRVVTPDFFEVFAIKPALGRFLNAEDRESVVISWETWSSAFGGDAGVLGRTMMLNGIPHRIVGVTPKHFRYPVQARVWTPLHFAPERLTRRGYNMNLTLLVRLKPGMSMDQASARISSYVTALKNDSYREGKTFGYFLDLHPFARFVAGDLRRTLWILWATALLVLFTGCASVAILLLSRTAGRRREIAVRLALGATRSQLLRQLTIESTVLGLAGGLGGIALAAAATSLLEDIAMPRKELLSLAGINTQLVLYGLGLSFLCGIVFGLAPAIQLLRQNQAAAMSRAPRRRLQSAFVAAEVATALVLLISTSLLLRSFWTAGQINPGFNPEGVSSAFLLKPKNDPTFVERAEAELQASAEGPSALAYPLPFSGGGLTSGFTIPGRQKQAGEPEWHGEAYFITPGYFATLQIPLLRGRVLTRQDSSAAPRVCVIDSKLAERFFPGADPIGQKIGMYGPAATIVGVVPAIRGTTLETASRPVVYYSLVQMPQFATAGVVVRSQGNGAGLIREAIRRANGSVPVFDVQTMRQRIDESLGLRRIVALLVLAFSGVCLALAAVGLHGVIGQLVNERRSEIAVRLALGARPGQILGRFMATGLRWAMVGVGTGLLGFAMLQRWIASLLFEVKPFDGPAIAFSCAVILLATVTAIWIPATRASRIRPQEILRQQ